MACIETNPLPCTSWWARRCWECVAPVRNDVCVRGNPVWMHVLKIGKSVDEIAEYVGEQRVRLGILKQGSTFSRCLVLHTLRVMKEAA